MFGIVFDVYACNRGWCQDASSQQSGTQAGSSVFGTAALLEHPHQNGPLFTSAALLEHPHQNGPLFTSKQK